MGTKPDTESQDYKKLVVGWIKDVILYVVAPASIALCAWLHGKILGHEERIIKLESKGDYQTELLKDLKEDLRDLKIEIRTVLQKHP